MNLKNSRAGANDKERSARFPRIPEVKVYGLHACLALISHRPDDAIRVYLEKSLTKRMGEFLSWCAQTKRVYRVVDRDQLQKVSGSAHHEGICIVARPLRTVSFDKLRVTFPQVPDQCLIVALDGVQNPHNVGAILRVCSHFGVRALIIERKHAVPLSGAVLRIAEGAGEIVPVVVVDSLCSALNVLQEQSIEVAATALEGEVLYEATLSSRCVFVFGGENAGISASVRESATRIITIPRASEIDSLNVACAASVFLANAVGRSWRSTNGANPRKPRD